MSVLYFYYLILRNISFFDGCRLSVILSVVIQDLSDSRLPFKLPSSCFVLSLRTKCAKYPHNSC